MYCGVVIRSGCRDVHRTARRSSGHWWWFCGGIAGLTEGVVSKKGVPCEELLQDDLLTLCCDGMDLLALYCVVNWNGFHVDLLSL